MTEIYQIYEDQHPLSNHVYASHAEAKQGLEDIHKTIQKHGDVLGFKVKKRVPWVINILALKKIYDDGSELKTNFVIHRSRMVSIAQVNS